MLENYYRFMGWDVETGKPLPETLRNLGLEHVVSARSALLLKTQIFIWGRLFEVRAHKNLFSMRNLVLVESKIEGVKYKMAYRRGSAPREMHKAVCADCGQECEVPFQPDPSRPVYCRDCWAKRRPQRRY